jgi:alpha-beta hydrolase superfamily lysophospholipase
MRRRNYSGWMAIGVLLISLLTGCGEKETGSVVTSDQATGDTRPAKYNCRDNWTIFGDLYDTPGKPKGVVILLHQRGGSGDDWHSLSLAIRQAGYEAFAIDQRGTGRSTAGPGQTGEFAPWDTTPDIEGAVYAMKDKGPIMLIGASYGANNALRYAAANPTIIRSLVLFSPSTDYHGLKTLDAVKKYKGPLLMFHAKDDKVAGDGPMDLDKASGSKNRKLRILEGAGHGIALLNPDTAQQTLDFIVRTLK